jgi:hypothetical protein
MGKTTDSGRRAGIRAPTTRLFNAVKKARKSIFKGFKVSGSRVERHLGMGSNVPTNVQLSGLSFSGKC